MAKKGQKFNKYPEELKLEIVNNRGEIFVETINILNIFIHIFPKAPDNH